MRRGGASSALAESHKGRRPISPWIVFPVMAGTQSVGGRLAAAYERPELDNRVLHVLAVGQQPWRSRRSG